MKSATLPAILLALLLTAISASVLPTVEATPPKTLKTFTPGSLDPGAITDPPLGWELRRNVQEFLFHYTITGGSETDDVVYITLVEPDIHWDFLMGEGWAYCDCPLSTGSYTLTVEADEYASGRLNYDIGFYLVPQPPVDFSGFMPANSNVVPNDLTFGVVFPTTANHQVILGVSGGDFEFFVDGESKGIVTGSTELQIDFTQGFHDFYVLPGLGDVRWSVQILGPPKLEVRIVGSPDPENPCPTLNPDAGQSTCIIGASVTASDGGDPTMIGVTYEWTKSGGSFNSTSSQWVEWTAPPGVADFTLTVQASADGYTSDTDSLAAKVVPEFPSAAFPFLIAIALTFLLMARRLRR